MDFMLGCYKGIKCKSSSISTGCIESGQDSARPVRLVFGLHNSVAKDKVSLSLANLLYGDFITRSRRLVPPVGRGFGPCSTRGIGAPGLLPRDCRVFEVLQAVAPAGHGGVGAAVYETDGGQAAAGRAATGGMEGGIELVFQDGTDGKRTGNIQHSTFNIQHRTGNSLCAGEGAAIGGDGFGRAGMGAEVDSGVANAAL